MDFQTHLVWNNFPFLIQGLWLTLSATTVAILIGIIQGGCLCVLKKSKNIMFARLSSYYITFFRTTPEMILIFWGYFCIPLITHQNIRFLVRLDNPRFCNSCLFSRNFSCRYRSYTKRSNRSSIFTFSSNYTPLAFSHYPPSSEINGATISQLFYWTYKNHNSTFRYWPSRISVTSLSSWWANIPLSWVFNSNRCHIFCDNVSFNVIF